MRNPNIDFDSRNLGDLANIAFAAGKNIELSGAVYGPASWGKKEFISRPGPYYYFLAGWCQLIKARKILEVGTHYAGSTLAMYSGMVSDADKRLVTVDVTDLNRESIAVKPEIVKIIGSGANKEIQKLMVRELASDTCDLLYVDALKDRDFVITVLNGITQLINVRWIVLDDIAIGGSMKRMWSEVVEKCGAADALDLATFNPEIRAPDVGFGLIRNRQHFPMLEVKTNNNIT